MDLSRIWCAIPVYNNAATVFDVARRARAQLPQVVVVDDGSTDGDLAQILAPLDVRIITHHENRGKGAAILSAHQFAAEQGADFLVTLDADGQHYPEDIPGFLPYLDERTILIGRRSKVIGTMPQRSEFGRAFSDFWVQLETGYRVVDSQSGFRVYPVDALGQLAFISRHYNFEVEVLTRAIWAGLRVGSVPIGVWYDPPETRVSSFEPFGDNVRLARLHTRLVARQLLPLPHRQVRLESGDADRSALSHEGDRPAAGWWSQNSSPLGLASAAALGLFVAALPWLWIRLLLLLYLSWRWHLNKPAALAGHALGLLPVVPWACLSLGQILFGTWPPTWAANWQTWPYPAEQPWTWQVGSMIVGPIIAAATWWITYRIALRVKSRLQPSRDTTTRDATDRRREPTDPQAPTESRP